MKFKKHWKRWLSIAVAIIGFSSYMLLGASSIFDIPELALWGDFLQYFVTGMAVFFGVNATIKIVNNED